MSIVLFIAVIFRSICFKNYVTRRYDNPISGWCASPDDNWRFVGRWCFNSELLLLLSFLLLLKLSFHLGWASGVKSYDQNEFCLDYFFLLLWMPIGSIKMLGFVRKHHRVNSKSSKEQAYKMLVHPKIEYAAAVWDPHTAKHINNLEKIQRRATRVVCNDHQQASSVSEMLKILNWPSLQNMQRAASLSTLFKIKKAKWKSSQTISTLSKQDQEEVMISNMLL